MYQARILDKNRKLVAILPGVRWHYTRRINEATSIEIYIPRETIDEHITPDHALYGFFMPTQPVVVEGAPRRERENKARYAEIAAFVQIYKGDVLKASGKITGRSLSQTVTVEAMTEEILLEGNLTPAQYGKVWDNWDLADVARDLLDGWQTIRVKAPEQWQQYMVDSYRVDLATEPGVVMLAKRASGQYYESGYITLKFDRNEISDFKAWDRIRWSADSDGSGGPGQEPIVRTTIQWSPNGSSWSAEWDGGLPEEVGYYIGGTYSQVYVRINLYTNDTESEDDEGNPVGVTPWVFAVELIARTYGDLVAGNIPAVTDVTIRGLDASHANCLAVLTAACEQTGWEFSVWNGTLNLAEKLGVDRTKDFVLRAGSNIEIQTLGDGDDELVNVLTAYGPGQGINRMEITLRDEASIAEYGEYPAAVEFDVETLAELEQKAQEFLSEHNSPKTQFEIAVAFEHDKEPDYGLGDKVRVANPETGIVTTTRIMAEAREYNEQGLSVHLELGQAGFTLAEVISGEKRVAKPLDPLQPTGVYARGIIKGIVVGCNAPKNDWAYTECHVSTAKGFVPGSATLVDKGKQTRFDIPNLDPGVRYYARVVHVDSAGRRSEPSREVSAVAGFVTGAEVEDGSLTPAKYKEVRNIMPWTGEGILDANHPYEYSFEIPSETTKIVHIKMSARAERFRTYARGAASGGEATYTSSVQETQVSSEAGLHHHALVSVPASTSSVTDNLLHWHRYVTVDFEQVEASTSSSTTGATVGIYDPGHSHSVGAIGGTGPGGEDNHTHTVEVYGSASSSSAGVQGGISDPGHAHVYTKTNISYAPEDTGGALSEDRTHSHEYWRAAAISEGGGEHTHTVPSHSHTVALSPHTHDLVYGIYEDTTPNQVLLYCDNGDGYGEPIALAVAPPDSTVPYVLCSEKDLTSFFTTPGWKRIKLTSNRRGRITFQIIAKLDITA